MKFNIISLIVFIISIILMILVLSLHIVGPHTALDAISEDIISFSSESSSLQLKTNILNKLVAAETRRFYILGSPVLILIILNCINLVHYRLTAPINTPASPTSGS
jgi:hypothetical protein